MEAITKSLIWTGRIVFVLLLLGEGLWLVNEIPHWFGEFSIYDFDYTPYSYIMIGGDGSANIYCAITLLLITAFMVWSAFILLPKL